MSDHELTKQQVDSILNALNKAIDQGPWDESNFLKVIGRNLRDIRDDVMTKTDVHLDARQVVSPYLTKQMSLRHGQQKIYIGLYCFNGSQMNAWEPIIANLAHQTISRPIYANEEDVKAMIKSKANPMNEAYVAIYVFPEDILPLSLDKMPMDKLGKRMLTLKDKALHLDGIDCFVHHSGVYRYRQGRLVKD